MKTRRSMFAASASAPPKRRKHPSPVNTNVWRSGFAALAPSPMPKPPPIADPSCVVQNGMFGFGRCVAHWRSLYAMQTSSTPNDPDIVLPQPPPHLHRALVAAEADVAEAVLVGGIDGVRAVHAPHRRRVQDLREHRRERPGVRGEGRLAAHVDDDALPGGNARELCEEFGDVACRERARM